MATLSDITAQMMFYVDETDPTFLNSSMAQLCVKNGYSEFVRTCQQVDPELFMTQVTINLVNQRTYDLGDPANNPCITGPTLNPPTALPFLRLVDVSYLWQANPLRLVPWTKVETYKQYAAMTNNTWMNIAWVPGYYILVKNTLEFPTALTAQFVLHYQYDPWPKTPIAGSYIDDLGQFADLIALLAAKVYAARDGTVNPALTALIADRKMQLLEYLATGRDASSGPNRVAILP